MCQGKGKVAKSSSPHCSGCVVLFLVSTCSFKLGLFFPPSHVQCVCVCVYTVMYLCVWGGGGGGGDVCFL